MFPGDWVGRQPVYTVGQVAAEIFDLRNLIAHGKATMEKHRKRIQFQVEPPELGGLNIGEWTHETLLSESSLFTLTAALKTVILSGQLELLADKRAWGQWLDSPSTT